jgi:hypothetical protein
MGDGYHKFYAEERIRPWEASFPSGTGSEFITALAAQTPNAWATPLLVGLNALAFVAMTIGGVDPWSPGAADLINWGAHYGSRGAVAAPEGESDPRRGKRDPPKSGKPGQDYPARPPTKLAPPRRSRGETRMIRDVRQRA